MKSKVLFSKKYFAKKQLIYHEHIKNLEHYLKILLLKTNFKYKT
jgi:hypothetical protein